MAHFAKLNEKNEVLEVLVVDNLELQDSQGVEHEVLGVAFLVRLLGWHNWKQTSYNGNFRKNYAGPGFFYDPARDAFIAHCPGPEWILNEETCQWEKNFIDKSDKTE